MRNKLGNLGWLGFLGFLGFMQPSLYYLFFLFFLFSLGFITRTYEGLKEGQRGLDLFIIFWGVILVAACAIIIVGNLVFSSWFGIVVGCLVGIGGLLFMINSSRYLRDAWTLEKQLTKTLDDSGRTRLARLIRKKRDYREADWFLAIVWLSAAAGVFALTMLLSQMQK